MPGKLLSLLICLLLIRCVANEKAVDAESVARGEKLFTGNCASCHSMDQDGIGPALGGITSLVSEQWIMNFVRDPKGVIDSNDERASVLYEKYKSVMPGFSQLTDEQLHDINLYLQTQKVPPGRPMLDPSALKDPIPEKIPMSELVVQIEEVTTIPASSQDGQLTRICKLDVRPDTRELVVLDLRGKLYTVRNNQPLVSLDMSKQRPAFIDRPGLATGFGSFAFHPDFKTNGLLYTTHTDSARTAPADFFYDDSIKVMLQWVLTEWKISNTDKITFDGNSREIFRINMVHSFHGVQEITFNPHAQHGDEDYGLLYVGIGDGSSVEFGYPQLANNKDRLWGKILRIDPKGTNSTNGKYGIPSSNPFGNEIFASGFRNPHRLSWTRSGQMIASNIGHHHIEALNLIEKGRNYGWPIREGSFVLDLEKGMNNVYALPEDDNSGVTYPVAEYDHDEGNAVSGGFDYWGEKIGKLKGKYIFGDIVRGRLFYVEIADLQIGKRAAIREFQLSLDGRRVTLKELCNADKVDVRFGRDATGDLYILTKPDGKVYRIVSAR
jgi:glucose/arabinose dehydrogenase/mono/diheme cytochrome c family protein